VAEGLDMKTITVSPGGVHQEDALKFVWPSASGQGSGLEFIGVLFETGTWQIIGGMDVVPWQYS